MALNIRPDCLHFRGHVPCAPHKERGVHCEDCPEYRRRAGRILLIKLGAAGDVIRTTPLLEPLRRDYPDHALTWVSDFPDLVPASVEDRVPFDPETLVWVRQTKFDLVINLDKDRQACALAREVEADRRMGFCLDDDGICAPITRGVTEAMAKAGRDKFLTGLFDDVNQACTLSYPQEIFRICGYEFAGEEYVLDRPASTPDFDLPSGKAVVGLNTGCGGRWTSRLWPEDRWAALARDLFDTVPDHFASASPLGDVVRGDRFVGTAALEHPQQLRDPLQLTEFEQRIDQCQSCQHGDLRIAFPFRQGDGPPQLHGGALFEDGGDILAAAAVLLRWALEAAGHRRRLARVPVRIHVNGIRGKSTVTRILAGLLACFLFVPALAGAQDPAEEPPAAEDP